LHPLAVTILIESDNSFVANFYLNMMIIIIFYFIDFTQFRLMKHHEVFAVEK
jgi:hypothetical protein